MAHTNENAQPEVKQAKSNEYLLSLLEKSKHLPDHEMEELEEEEKRMRENVKDKPSRAKFYNLLFRKFLLGADNSAKLSDVRWKWRAEQETKEKDVALKKKIEAEEEDKRVRQERVEEYKAALELGNDHIDQSAPSSIAPTAPPVTPTTPAATPVVNAAAPCNPGCVPPSKKRAAQEEREKQRTAKKGKYFWWNCRSKKNKEYEEPCNGRRTEEYTQCVQAAGDGIEERHCRAKYNGDWLCECKYWNRHYWQHCDGCGDFRKNSWEYTVEDDSLQEAPDSDRSSMTEAQKTTLWFKTEGRFMNPKRRRKY
ncbi:Nn.00g052270.m01.CDS01 [Neocucurbitaria sp. VM-36]